MNKKLVLGDFFVIQQHISLFYLGDLQVVLAFIGRIDRI